MLRIRLDTFRMKIFFRGYLLWATILAFFLLQTASFMFLHTVFVYTDAGNKIRWFSFLHDAFSGLYLSLSPSYKR
jgi:RsiW-degrading membrane proteinase PrsW (M82 family)